MTIYTVKRGDSIDSIASAYGVGTDTIIYNNQLVYPYKLAIGQALLLSAGPSLSYGRNVVSNGYAYPFIGRYNLTQTLPYLTGLFIFSYGFTTDGALVYPPLDDSWMITLATEAGTAPVLTLTPFGVDGQFNNNLISAIVNDQEAQNRLIAEISATLLAKGFRGVDIDFEFILPSDRVPFAQFVENVRIAVNTLGYPVSVALAPKISDTQQGLLYEGKDYSLLGAAANSVLLMTYEWGYTYGPPMAVAPLNKVREVVEYAITRIPADKIDLGIPNYGYDWILPYQRGVSAARTIGNVEAVQIAIENGAEILFDPVALSPHFNYTKNGQEHEVWFEDVRSLREKFSLVNSYRLRGVGYWQIMQLFRANWLLLADSFYIDR